MSSYVENALRLHDKLLDLWTDLHKWSDSTFGDASVRGPKGPLRHLSKEALETAESNDPEEYADCLLLLLDAIRRNGGKLEHVVDEASRKMQINKARRFPSVEDQDHESAIEHLQDTKSRAG